MDRAANPDSPTRARTLGELMETSSERGNTRIDTTMDALMNSVSGRAVQARVNAEANFVDNGRDLVATMTSMGGALADLTTSMPGTTEALSALQSAAMSLAGTMALMNVASGGGAGIAASRVAASATARTASSAVTRAAGSRLGYALGGAGSVLFYEGDTTGGPTTSEADRFEGVMRNLTPAARDAYRGSLADSSTAEGRAFNAELGRAIADRGTTAGGGIISLSAETIRQLVDGVGRATGRSLASGAPADGRTPGEPGRR
jgi:hypothetical protein